MAAAPSLGSLLLRGLRGRCPRCGEGRLFDGFLEVAGECPACRLGLAEHDSGDGPAVAATFILGAGVVAPAALLELAVAPPLWVHAVLWGPLVIGGTLVLLRPLKGVTVALQYRYRGLDEPARPGGL
jgi:uncharacterized protein (DUF983 family)